MAIQVTLKGLLGRSDQIIPKSSRFHFYNALVLLADISHYFVF